MVNTNLACLASSDEAPHYLCNLGCGDMIPRQHEEGADKAALQQMQLSLGNDACVMLRASQTSRG